MLALYTEFTSHFAYLYILSTLLRFENIETDLTQFGSNKTLFMIFYRIHDSL